MSQAIDRVENDLRQTAIAQGIGEQFALVIRAARAAKPCIHGVPLVDYCPTCDAPGTASRHARDADFVNPQFSKEPSDGRG